MLLNEYELLAARKLHNARVDSPRLCARLICAEVLGLDKAALIREASRRLYPKEIASLNEVLQKRSSGYPMAYILGRKEFYGRDFLLDGQTLIPRPETELLVEKALEFLPEDRLYFADLGAGCGCIGISLALERPSWRGILLDKSKNCLALCAQNKRSLGADLRLDIVQGDIFSLPFKASSLDLLVSNPPYIAESERSQVMAEVLNFEPEQALFSGSDGLGHLRALIALAARFLRPGGLILLEHGHAQGQDLRLQLEADYFKDIQTFRDLAGLERCTLAWHGRQ